MITFIPMSKTKTRGKFSSRFLRILSGITPLKNPLKKFKRKWISNSESTKTRFPQFYNKCIQQGWSQSENSLKSSWEAGLKFKKMSSITFWVKSRSNPKLSTTLLIVSWFETFSLGHHSKRWAEIWIK